MVFVSRYGHMTGNGLFLRPVFKSQLILYQMSGTCSDTQSELTFAHPAREVLDYTQRNVSVLMEAFNVRPGKFNMNSYSVKGLYLKMLYFWCVY